jgi:hypothetical protein
MEDRLAMSFTSWPLQFGLDLAETVGSIPPTLYHYTGLKGVLGIGNSCAVHAISTDDSKDRTEIEFGVGVVREEIKRRIAESGLTSFARMLLKSLPKALSARKRWTFVACFCPELGSSFHCGEYGGYCLEFDTYSTREPQLRPPVFYADVQYQHVIYDRTEQYEAIRQAIDSISACAVRNTRGEPQGPWAESMITIHTRTAAQCLMEIIASLKSSSFANDREWRIVCHPRSSLASSAPDLDDANFNSLIKIRDDSKRYIDLSVRPQGEILTAFPRAVVPFNKIHVPQDVYSRDEERLAIMEMLEANGRSDIPVIPFP